MPSSIPVNDIGTALLERLIPTITTWNRLEARPRSQSFERALQAEVRDALWMLTKQWQLGEFRGSDAGSPVFAKLLMETTRLTKYQAAAGNAELFDYSVPLETRSRHWQGEPWMVEHSMSIWSQIRRTMPTTGFLLSRPATMPHSIFEPENSWLGPLAS